MHYLQFVPITTCRLLFHAVVFSPTKCSPFFCSTFFDACAPGHLAGARPPFVIGCRESVRGLGCRGGGEHGQSLDGGNDYPLGLGTPLGGESKRETVETKYLAGLGSMCGAWQALQSGRMLAPLFGVGTC